MTDKLTDAGRGIAKAVALDKYNTWGIKFEGQSKPCIELVADHRTDAKFAALVAKAINAAPEQSQ